MKIEKRPSGSYRIRKTFEGKSYSVTVGHKPTNAEAEKLIMRKIAENQSKEIRTHALSQTFLEASEQMIEDKRNVLSPSTIRDYVGRSKRLSKAFSSLPIMEITQQDVQREINRLSAKYSGKTVSNYHGFISSVFAYYRPDFVLTTNLPPKQKKDVYVPNNDDIRKVLNASKGTQFELPILLGCLGMRRGEICALTMDDIDFEHNKISINKAMAQNDKEEWIVKPSPKTNASNRVITVPDRVIELIKTQGLFNNHPGYITAWMLDTERELGIPTFSLHKLRHYFASASHDKGLSDADIMRFGGWSTDNVMKRVYRHAMEDKGKAISDKILSDLS